MTTRQQYVECLLAMPGNYTCSYLADRLRETDDMIEDETVFMAEHPVDTPEEAAQYVSGLFAHPPVRVWLADGSEHTIGADVLGRIEPPGAVGPVGLRRRLLSIGPGSPQARHAVGLDGGIAAHERDGFGSRLRYEQTVEEVAVVKRQSLHDREVGGVDGKQVEAIADHVMGDEIRNRALQLELADARLDGDLPQADDADEVHVAGVFQQTTGQGR